MCERPGAPEAIGLAGDNRAADCTAIEMLDRHAECMDANDEVVDPTEVIDELFDGWRDRHTQSTDTSKMRRQRSLGQVAAILSLTAHTYETAALLRPAMPDAVTMAHMPLVRTIYETALTVLWIDKVDDAAQAWLNEFVRQRGVLRETMAKSTSLAQYAAAVTHVDDDKPDTSGSVDSEARHFERLSQRLQLDGAYAYYRLLCQMTHPSATAADQYLAPSETSAFAFNPRPAPLENSRTWACLVAGCLVWSARVVDYIDGSARRNDLRSCARRLGIKADLGWSTA